ncbi:MAG: nucleotide-binding protein, partial [Candidatus Lokiarchaeota archaeon]|nr:nucleotide-binding protein [Candidatus Lokiarchaeota archaeon]
MNSDDYNREAILEKLSSFENNFPTNKMQIIIFLKSIIDFFESDLPNTGNFGYLKNKFKELFNPNTERLIYFYSHTKDLLHTYLRKLRVSIEQDFQTNKTTVSYNNKNIFIVHGSDNEMKEAVARLLETLGLIPIILHEQPNEGKTIIEKFERYSDVGF